MSIDYDRLKALLDETPPGPWEVEEFDEQYAGCPPCTEFYLGSDGFQNIATAETTERYYDQARVNFELIALAPDIARELLRLRRELTDLRDLMWTHARYQRSDGYDTAADWTRDHADRLNRIIEGNQK